MVKASNSQVECELGPGPRDEGKPRAYGIVGGEKESQGLTALLAFRQKKEGPKPPQR